MGHHDAVTRLVEFQRTGSGFDGVWVEIAPIVGAFARQALRKKGIRTASGGDDHAVDDVVNQTAARLLGLSDPSAGGRFDPAKAATTGLSGLRGWLWRVVDRQAADWARDFRGGRGTKILSERTLDLNCLPDSDDASSLLDRQVAKVVRPDLLPILEACIARLEDPFQRRIVRLKLHDGLSLRETADALDVAVSRVQRQLCSAYAKLREMLDDGGLDGTWLAA